MRLYPWLLATGSFGVLGLVTLTAQQDLSPNFASDVEPIIRGNCVICHHPEGIGPFSLQTYEQVRRRGRQIHEVTQSRYMPPWKPDPDYGPPLIGERRLSEAQIQTLASWYASGMPPGDLDSLPPIEEIKSDWVLGEPDLVMDLPEAFTLVSEGEDVYRNFVLPIPLSETRYVRAFQLKPRTQLAIHHALVMIDDTGRSRVRDAEDEDIGFDGMGVGASKPPNGHILGWTPGQDPYEAYPGTAWAMQPGQDLVLQLHLLPTGKEEAINPQLGFYFADSPPTNSAYVFQLRRYDLDIAPGETDYLVESSLELPVAGKVVSVYPHAHYIGKDIQMFATLPDGT
ncbi:MAG: hypothetical protein F6K19_48150, partial [Cyanothece sp. SIO1E1]|nr:hypothetical protein [Cyanothece sp. SIO1E1]